MKEVTVWNGKPRWMWCWDDNENDKCKGYVLCILTYEQMKEGKANFPVCTYDVNYKNCAEIEETKRPCTKEELLDMLKKQGLLMLKNKDNRYYTISKMDSTKVKFCDEGFFDFDYEHLCTMFTLINGTELWVKE